MPNYIRAEAVVDYNASSDTTAFTMEAPFAGKLYVGRSFGRIEEVVGSMTTTVGVASIEVAGTEIATLTAVPADAVGETDPFVVDASDTTAANGEGVYAFSRGDNIEVLTKTQAVDGTVTGTVRAYLYMEFGV